MYLRQFLSPLPPCISFPGIQRHCSGGIDVLKQIRSSEIKVPVLILSIYPEEQYAVRALRAGASGYLTKNCETDTLIEAIKKVASGGKYVSESLAENLHMILDWILKSPFMQLFQIVNSMYFVKFLRAKQFLRLPVRWR